mgnify:CR=1 FL=1
MSKTLLPVGGLSHNVVFRGVRGAEPPGLASLRTAFTLGWGEVLFYSTKDSTEALLNAWLGLGAYKNLCGYS